MHYDWNFGRLLPYAEAFGRGAITTLALTLIVVVLGTVAGIPLGVLMMRRAVRIIAIPIIDVVRAIPPLVLLLFAYFLLTPQVIGVVLSSFWVAAFALSANLAAFTAEVVRSALESVPLGEVEAAKVLGMSREQIRSHIAFPHVIRNTLPAMTVLYIGMLKLTSLAAVINVRETVFVAQTVVADVSRSLESWIVVAAIYVAIAVPATYGARSLERRLAKGRPAR